MPVAGAKKPEKIPTAERRAQRTEATRIALIEAAGRVIGKYGYAGCSIARVTARAKIAHGAFYLYFQSQQELFDNVLPTLGRRMLTYVADQLTGSSTLYELEKASVGANFDYLRKHPYMYRVLQEAEPFVPKALEVYQDSVNRAYARSLRRALGLDISDEQYDALAIMLIGVRTNLTKYFSLINHVAHPLPEDVTEMYLEFATHGIMAAAKRAEKLNAIGPKKVETLAAPASKRAAAKE